MKRAQQHVLLALTALAVGLCAVPSVTWAQTVPAVPAGVVATRGFQVITLTWAPITGATSYVVYRGIATSTTAPGIYASGITSALNDTDYYVDTGVTGSTLYSYKVASVNAAGTSAPSAVATAAANTDTDAVSFRTNISHTAQAIMPDLQPPLGIAFDTALPGTVSNPLVFTPLDVAIKPPFGRYLADVLVTVYGNATTPANLYAINAVDGGAKEWLPPLNGGVVQPQGADPVPLPLSLAGFGAVTYDPFNGLITATTDGNVYGGCRTGNIQALYGYNPSVGGANIGDPVWNQATYLPTSPDCDAIGQMPGQSGFMSPTSANGVAYVNGSFENGDLYAVNEANGNILWEEFTGLGYTSPSISPDGSDVFVTADQYYNYNAQTGGLNWVVRSAFNGVPNFTSAYYGGSLYAWDYETAPADLDVALNQTDGSIVHTYSPQGRTAYDNGMMFGIISNVLTATNVSTGNFTTVWSTNLAPHTAVTDPTVVDAAPSGTSANGLVYVGTSDKKLLEFDENTGALLHTYNLGESPSAGAETGSPTPETIDMGAGDGLIALAAGTHVIGLQSLYPPQVYYNPPTPNSYGWYNVPVYVTSNGPEGATSWYSSIGQSGPFQPFPAVLEYGDNSPFDGNGIHNLWFVSEDSQGNESNIYQIPPIKIDRDAPVTTDVLSGSEVSGDYFGAVTITLSANDNFYPPADNVAVSGVDQTFYKIDGATSWTAYTAPVNITASGAHTVYFYSDDYAGNNEAGKSVSFTIVSAPITIAFSPAQPNGSNGWYTVPVTVTLSSAIGGGISYALDNGPETAYAQPFKITGNAIHTLDYGSDYVSTLDQSATVQIDSAAPVTTATISGTNTPKGYESPVTVTLTPVETVSGVASTSYTVTYNGVSQGLQTVAGSSPVPIQETGSGSYSIAYYATSNAGVVEATQTTTFGIEDTTPPVTTATLTGTQNPDSSYQSVVTVTLTATDSLSTVTATYWALNPPSPKNISYTPYSGPFQVSTAGVDTLYYYSVDAAGNSETPHELQFTIEEPTVTAALSPPTPNGNNGWYTTAVQITLTINFGSIDYQIDGGIPKVYTSPIVVSTNGSHTVTYYGTNAAGQKFASATVSFKIDATPPVTTATASGPTNPAGVYSTGASITVTAQPDISGVPTISYQIDSGPTLTYSRPVSITTPGQHVFTYYATDPAGNVESPQEVTLLVGPYDLYQFPAGRQMIAAPVDDSAYTLSEIFDVAGVSLFTWNPATELYIASPTSPANTIHPGVGYWVNFASTTNLIDIGAYADTTQPFDIPLKPGWNLIGDPGPVAVTASNVSVQTSRVTESFVDAAATNVISAVFFTWQAGDTSYQISQGANAPFVPFEGYWFYAYQPCTLIFPPSSN